MQNSNNLMDTSLFVYSKKDSLSNAFASKKVVEKAPSWSRFSFIFFTQIVFFSIFSVLASSSPSQNNRDNCKKIMLVNRRHLKTRILCLEVIFVWSHSSTWALMYKNTQMWAKFYVTRNLSVSTYAKLDARPDAEKYANVSAALLVCSLR